MFAQVSLAKLFKVSLVVVLAFAVVSAHINDSDDDEKPVLLTVRG